MNLSKKISKDNIVKGLRNLSKIRPNMKHGTLLTVSALILILFIAFTIRVLPLRWEIQTGALHLSEYDPYYQFSLTEKMVEDGLFSPYWPTEWIDTQRWYPDGINMAASYPALPMTAAVLYHIVSFMGFNVALVDLCTFFPVIFGVLACLLIYFLGKEINGVSVGLFASLFLALSPTFIQRTSLGFFDDETVGIVALLAFTILFLRSIDRDKPLNSTVKYSLGAAAFLAYFISGWGAAYYIVGLTVLFVFVMLLLKRYSTQLLISYSVTFGLGLFIAINVPYVSTSYLTTFAVLPVAGIFVLLCLWEVFRSIKTYETKIKVIAIILALGVTFSVILWQFGLIQSIGDKFVNVLNPFGRSSSALFESVAEHKITAWGSLYYNLGISIIFFSVGFFFLLRNFTNKNLFLTLFGLTSLYFSASLVRLLVLFAPAFSIIMAVGIFGLLKPFKTLIRENQKTHAKKKYRLGYVGKEFTVGTILLILLLLTTTFAFSPQTDGGIPRVYSSADIPVVITGGGLPFVTNEPITQWFDMLQFLNSLPDSSKTVVLSWWDYGYWLSELGNVTSIADNATINSTQIENIGFSFLANETLSLKMLELYDADYILVYTAFSVDGYWFGYADEGKWFAMAQISGAASERFVDTGFIDEESVWVDDTRFANFTESGLIWTDYGTNSTIYKLMSFAKHSWLSVNAPTTADPDAWIEPTYFEEAYFAGLELTENESRSKYGGIVPLVCLYKIDWEKYQSDLNSTT